MNQESQEKTEHELDIRRADCRSKFWQEAQAEEQRKHTMKTPAEWAEIFDLSPCPWEKVVEAIQADARADVLRNAAGLVIDRNAHVAQPLADVLNKFDA